MIAVDSSILVGAICREADVVAIAPLLLTERIALAATVVVEVNAWCARHMGARRAAWFDDLLGQPTVSVSPFTGAMAALASEAFRTMGRGSGHPAALNFGDAMVYGHAAALGLPLLFKGNDFDRTDLALDPRSIVPRLSSPS